MTLDKDSTSLHRSNVAGSPEKDCYPRGQQTKSSDYEPIAPQAP